MLDGYIEFIIDESGRYFMKITFTFRHMESTDALKNQAEERILRLGKYLDASAQCHVILSSEKYLHKAEINVVYNGNNICGKETSEDMYNSIQRATDKIEKQVKKYRDRIISSKPKEGAKLKMQFKLFETSEQEDKKLDQKIIETKEFHAIPMSVDEALMQMDLLNNDILVFLNAKTDHINVIYRKNGTKYGLIETL
jgi:putative sigma-54 modulation protein